MNICFICKYPPIEGGVSMHGYWSARGLAQRGHKVFVVTNANEVESTFRIQLTKTDKAPGGEYARVFPESSGFVKVYSTEPPNRSDLYYIPMNNPTVTRLATIATNVIRAEDCKVIFAYYFEPYGLSAHLASGWTGIPYVLKHAGSDLYRLAVLEELQTAYVEAMHRANRIISPGSLRETIISYGVSEDKITSDVAFRLPPEYFNPDGPALDIPKSLARIAATDPDSFDQCYGPLTQSLPILGIYGKLGEYKGSFDLLFAMSKLIQDGFPFYLVAMSNGWRESHFRQLVEKLKITEYVRILPFQPHWRVPEFIRSCTAVAFLERDFPITAHGPTIPSEVIACGKCLVFSEEVARKQPFRLRMRNFKNVVIAPDPKKHESLASCLRFALEDSRRAEAIGRLGFDELVINRDHDKYLDQFELLLTQVADEKPVAKRDDSKVASTPDPVASNAAVAVQSFFPFTYALLTDEQKERLKETIDGHSPSEPKRAGALSVELLSFLNNGLGGDLFSIREVCRYECLLHEWEKTVKATSEISKYGLAAPVDELGSHLPYLKGSVNIVQFERDVQAIIASVEKELSLPQANSHIKVLFHSSSLPMRINDSTEHLLELLAEGSKTADEVFEKLVDHHSAEGGGDLTQIRDSYFSVLEQLYWQGIIEFGPAPQPIAVTAN